MKRVLFIALLGCFLLPSIGNAAFVKYSASGAVSDKYGNVLPISGEIFFDDQLRLWNAGYPEGEATPIKEGGWQYGYDITFFSLYVGDYSFSGSTGWLYMELINDPNTGNIEHWDLMWWLNGYDWTTWNYWGGENFGFYTPDTAPVQWSSLSDLIHFHHFSYWNFQCPILGDGREHLPVLNLTLARQDFTAVPEPATGILFCAGIIIAAGYGRYRRRTVR